MTTLVWINDETSPFRGTLKKLNRAKYHLGKLRALIDGYMSRKPYSIRLNQDVKGGEIGFFISVQELPPLEQWALLIGDTVHNLRSSLDFLVWTLVGLEDPSALSKKTASRIGFPIFCDANEFSKKSKGKVRGAHSEAITRIERLQPYGGGNDLFYHISKLDNMDKHRLLIPAGMLPGGLMEGNMITYDIREGHRIEPVSPSEFRFEDGAPLLWLRPVNCQIFFKPDMDNQFTLSIKFAQPVIVKGIVVLDFLDNAVNLVESSLKPIIQWAFGEYGHLSPHVLKAKADEAKGSST
jgi:hypothetical protein